MTISRRGLFRTAGVAAVVGTVGVSASARAQGTSGPPEPLRLARVWATSAQREKLAAFDDTHVVFDDGSVEYLLWPGDLAKLQATGLRFEITVSDLVARDAALPAGISTVAAQPGESRTGDYRTYEAYEADMRALAKRYPSKARLIALPHKTLEGRTVYALEIANNVKRQDGRPVFYQDGCHHAREWPAAEVPLMWAYDLLENGGKDARLKAILDHVRNVIVPVVNADGFAYTRSFPPVETGEVAGRTNPAPPEAVVLGGQGRYVRKNRRTLLGPGLGTGLRNGDLPKPTRADAIGVDPNRNYSYAWGDHVGGSSSDMFSQTYRGSDPLSEQESKNVAGLLKGCHATAMITHHTSGNLLLWPWGDTKDDAPDDAILQGLGRAMATYNGYKGQKSVQLYVTTGTTEDYAYGVFGSISYTFEHAGSSFHPPYATTVPAMYAKNREALILLALYGCVAPEDRPSVKLTSEAKEKLAEFKQRGQLLHGIISGRAVDRRGRPVAAKLTLTKSFDTVLWDKERNPLRQYAFPEQIVTTMQAGGDGRFRWHVNPSTRPAVAFAGGKESYLLTVTGPSGEGVSRGLVVRRGQRIDLGTLVVD